MSLRIGVVGLGHLGNIHLACLQATEFEVVGMYDIRPERLETISQQYGIPAFDNLEALIEECDAIDIVSTTSSHYEIAHKVLEHGKHLFIEKPFVKTSAEGQILNSLAVAKNCKVQLGHVERYNPVIQKIKNLGLKPKFIEAHRLASFNPRGNDVSVVMDLMMHDLDLLCYIVDSDIEEVAANGVNVIEDTPDICNARLQFKNGVVANLTASRISLKQMRKFRIFQNDKYLSLDLLNKEAQIISLSDEPVENAMTLESKKGKKYLTMESPEMTENNAIKDELNDFYYSIINDLPTKVSIEDGLKSLKMAEMIQDSIFENHKKAIQ